MRNIGLALLLLGATLGIFSYWGVETQAGRREFDEMSGILPLFAGALGVVAGIAGIALLVVWRTRLNRSSPRGNNSDFR